ncbi:MAG: MBL fold metallo-hydrolase [Candidatus Bathyarchaeota archaeon]|jgi:putative mRNA 3-end processing factor
MGKLQINFLGGTREIGRSAIAVKTNDTQVLLDYGVIFNHTPGFPMHVPSKEVDALILTHSHLDHSGALPIFYIYKNIPLYTNKISQELNQLLISDFIHLSSYYLPFEYLELNTMKKNSKHLDFGVKKKVKDISFKLLNAGHIPGSSQIMVEAEGKKLLYTGDFNTDDTRLLKGATMKHKDLDGVIIESTYAAEEHTDRIELEKQFVLETTDIVESGGIALIPAFGVGRSQEIACILAAHNFRHRVTIDGMVRGANTIMMKHGEFLRDPRLLKDALGSAYWVQGWKDRRKVTKKPGVIITTAGMLKGGPSVFYISKIGKKVQNAVFLVSYQIEGTPGRQLLENGVCMVNGKLTKIKAKVNNFDFSSHCGASELKEFLKKLGGNPEIYVVHGEEKNCKFLAKWTKQELGLKAKAPKTGDTVKI